MKRRWFLTVKTADGELAVAGEFEADTMLEAIELAEEQGRAACPGKRLLTTHAALQDFIHGLRWPSALTREVAA